MLQDCGQAAVTQTATRRPSVAMQLAGPTPLSCRPKKSTMFEDLQCISPILPGVRCEGKIYVDCS